MATTFSYRGAHRPLPLRLANVAGRLLGPAGARLTSLDPDSLLAAARPRAGVGHQEAGFREPLAQLTRSIDDEARLHPVGRWAVRSELIDLAAKRFRIQEHLRSHPEVLDVPVERPVFIVGFPRTGSTFLHNLIALDPATRVPRLWELLNPVPLDGGDRARIEAARAYVRSVERVSPLALKIHPMGAEDPDECRMLFETCFVGPQYLLYYNVPSYFAWFEALAESRLTEACLDLRRQIQIIKQGDGGRRWVGKNPSHSFFGRGLVRAFPDACIAQLHRDPLEAVPSICSLAAAYRSIFSDHVDLADVGREGLRLFGIAMSRMQEMRERPEGATFCDIHYEDIVADPIGVVRRIYDHAGLSLDAGVESRMLQYVERNPQHKHGVHRYAAEQYGLDRARIERAAEPYAHWAERLPTEGG